MLPCSKLCIIWHCQVIDKSFKITGNLFFHSSVTSQLLLSYRPYFVASTCPKDDLRRVLQVKIVLVTITTNNPWRFKYSHDFEAFSWCFRFQTLQLLNFVATSLPPNLSMQLDVSTDLPKDLQCWQRWQRIPSLEITGSHWASTWICWNDLAKLNDAHRNTNIWWIIAETEKRFTCQLATNIHWQCVFFLANQ